MKRGAGDDRQFACTTAWVLIHPGESTGGTPAASVVPKLRLETLIPDALLSPRAERSGRSGVRVSTGSRDVLCFRFNSDRRKDGFLARGRSGASRICGPKLSLGPRSKVSKGRVLWNPAFCGIDTLAGAAARESDPITAPSVYNFTLKSIKIVGFVAFRRTAGYVVRSFHVSIDIRRTHTHTVGHDSGFDRPLHGIHNDATLAGLGLFPAVLPGLGQ